MFSLEIINMVIAQMGGSGTPGTLPWLRPCEDPHVSFFIIQCQVPPVQCIHTEIYSLKRYDKSSYANEF